MDCVRFLVLLVFLFLLFLSVVMASHVVFVSGFKIRTALICQIAAFIVGSILVILIYYTNNNVYFTGKVLLVAGAMALSVALSYLGAPIPFRAVASAASVALFAFGAVSLAGALIQELLLPQEVIETSSTERIVLAKLQDILGEEYDANDYVIVRDGIYTMYDSADGSRILVPEIKVVIQTVASDEPPAYVIYTIDKYYVKYRENQEIRQKHDSFEKLVLEVPSGTYIIVHLPDSHTSPKPSPYAK